MQRGSDRSAAAAILAVQRQRFCTFGNNALATNRAEVIGRGWRRAAPLRTFPARQASIIVSVERLW